MAIKAGRVGVNPNYVDKEGRPLYDNSYLKELLRKEGIITLFTKEGNPISIDNAVAGRVYDLVVNMSPKQAGTGTPSPTNVREFSNYTGLTITLNNVDTEISFDDPVYIGNLNPITGTLVSEYGFIEYDGSEDENWVKGLASNCFSIARGTVPADLHPGDYITSSFTPNDSGVPGTMYVGTNYVNVSYVHEIEDVADFKTYLSTHPLQICYRLTSPVTVQLTAQDIQLRAGSNTVSSDAGTTMNIKYLGTLVPGGANGRSLNRSLSLNREVIDGEERKEIQEEIKEEVKEVPVEEPVTTKKSTKKSTK